MYAYVHMTNEVNVMRKGLKLAENAAYPDLSLRAIQQ